MILCITPNPAIDRTIILPDLVLGSVHRAYKTIVAAGGKGLNVARAIQRQGGQPLCMGFAGGYSGRLLAELAQHEGLESSWTWTRDETRTCTILVSEGRDATVINEPGMPVSPSDWKQLRENVYRSNSSARLVCISGSLPPNSSEEDFYSLLDIMLESGRQVWVDTSGVALEAVLKNPRVCIKVNGHEIGEALGIQVNDFSSAERALDQLGERAPIVCVITLGSKGAILATRNGRWLARPPQIRVVSTVGSGDAFLGGLVTALDQGDGWADALRNGVATGSANALSAGGGRFALQDFNRVHEEIQIQYR